MNGNEIRRKRVAICREMILRGASKEQILGRVATWKVGPGTAKSYFDEAINDIRKLMEKKNG